MRPLWQALSAAVVALLPLRAQGTPADLRGLKVYHVSISAGDSSIRAAIDPGVLQATVELEMRRAGIPVLSQDTSAFAVGMVEITVWGYTMAGTHSYVYFTTLSVKRWVTAEPSGPDNPIFPASVWERSWIGNVAELQSAVKEGLSGKATELANAILAAKGRQ